LMSPSISQYHPDPTFIPFSSKCFSCPDISILRWIQREICRRARSCLSCHSHNAQPTSCEVSRLVLKFVGQFVHISCSLPYLCLELTILLFPRESSPISTALKL
jgi:hypothetical protein